MALRHYADQPAHSCPSRGLLKTSRNLRQPSFQALVKVEKEGKWWSTTVAEVDCSLVRVTYVKDGAEEWIFRGSERLGPIYSKLEASKNVAASDGSWSRSKRFNVTEGSNVIEYNKEKKSFAKKSTAGKRNVETSTEDEGIKPKSDGEIIQSSLNSHAAPRTFKSHTCSPKCVSRAEYNYNDAGVKVGGQVLMIPLTFGWAREVAKHSNNGLRKVCYVAPCGRRLRSPEEVHRYLRVTKLRMEMDFFSFEWWLHVRDRFQVEQKFIQIKDISYGAENVAVSCCNGVDGTYVEHIDYSTRRLPQKDVLITTDPEFLTGCDCEDDCRDRKRCSCWQLTIQSTRGDKDNRVKHNVGYEFRRLPVRVFVTFHHAVPTNILIIFPGLCINRNFRM